MTSASEMIDVPADGLCFYHCLGYALQQRSSNSIRAEICEILVQMGFEEEAIRLQKEGSDGYPDELAFVAASRLLSGRLEVRSLEGQVLSYGDGPCRLRIVQTMIYDGAGHGSPHFQILSDHAERQLDNAYAAMGEKKSDRIFYRVVCERNLPYSRNECRAYFKRRQAQSASGVVSHAEVPRDRELSSLRSFVQDRVGGEHEIWPAVQAAAMPFTRVEVRRVLREVRPEKTDYTALAAVHANMQPQ